MAEPHIQQHKGWPKGKRLYCNSRSKPSGVRALKRTLERLGGRVLDPDTEVGRVLDAWRDALIHDLGGEEGLSTQELALVDVAVRGYLLLSSVDCWLLMS